MTRRLLFTDEALAEIDDAADYLESQVAGLGDEFRLETADRLAILCEHPNAYPVFRADTRQILLRRFQFKIIYQVREPYVAIIAIGHTARSDDFWRDRLST